MIARPIRVLVVEDSLTIRRHIVETLSDDPTFEVVGEAADGREAIELCERLRPDVITMDMVMPGMSGLAATEHIMGWFPTPILVVSASMNRGEAFNTFEALSAGAVDVIDKPSGDAVEPDWEPRLRAALKRVSRVPVIAHPRARLRRTPPSESRATAPSSGEAEAVLIGGSTGAPPAVATILESLPRDFPLPILVVVHIGSSFALPFGEWLDDVSPVRVTVARDRERLPPRGTPGVIVAPADRHLVIEKGLIRLSDGPERHSCRPSIDVLFESAARELGSRAAAVLLTGMGKDGAAGLLGIRRAGGHTIAQDEATSVIFAMPAEAIRIGAAERVLPIGEIGPAVRALGRGGSR